jgi:hypothetical protein
VCKGFGWLMRTDGGAWGGYPVTIPKYLPVEGERAAGIPLIIWLVHAVTCDTWGGGFLSGDPYFV